MSTTVTSESSSSTDVWVAVCDLADLVRERGSAALVDGVQMALVRTHDDRVHAVQQLDPYSGAHVLSRGIVGSRGERATIISPMYKQVFALDTGECLEPAGEEPVDLVTWPVRVQGSTVFVLPSHEVHPAVATTRTAAA